ncbi:unnamed protein product [Hyaloperonospora brassicae]|uniref:PH domain-containing protein n=1 Tax=Hyaloperonospora brassicae TaxID=162125 RepID=A0AAV0UHD6_HYABA|nr:unnamed protein product [Hyaloperonospora brassicae]
MDNEAITFSGTLQVRACHAFWKKTPVHLTTCRKDYRSELPVLLVRRSRVLGGEFRVPLDPCVHPVRLLPTTRKMAAKHELALAYGWHSKRVRLRAPNVTTYRQWMRLVRAALESGRRPLVPCSPTGPRQDLECSSLASTMTSSNNTSTSRSTTTITVDQPLQEEEEEEEEQEVEGDVSSDRERGAHHFCDYNGITSEWQNCSASFDTEQTTDHHRSTACRVNEAAAPLCIADLCRTAVGSCRSGRREREVQHDHRLDPFDWSSSCCVPASFAERSPASAWRHKSYLRTLSFSWWTATLSNLTGDT